MPLKTNTIEEPALNMTPMIDIVFLLVIFFMVGAKFSEHKEYDHKIELPTSASVQPLTNLPDELVVNVRVDGTILLGRDEVSVADLESRLKAAKENYAEQLVRIRADGAVPYKQVIRVLEVCKDRAGITSIALAYKPISGDAAAGGSTGESR